MNGKGYKTLTTTNIWYISRYAQWFGDDDITSFWSDAKGAALSDTLGNEPIKVKGFDLDAHWWEIKVEKD